MKTQRKEAQRYRGAEGGDGVWHKIRPRYKRKRQRCGAEPAAMGCGGKGQCVNVVCASPLLADEQPALPLGRKHGEK